MAEKIPTPCVILVRNPHPKRLEILGISGEAGALHTFKDEGEAELFAKHNFLCQKWPHQIVPLTELLG